MKLPRRLLPALVLLALNGCAAMHTNRPLPDSDDMPETAFDSAKGSAGGVMVPGSLWSLTSDSRAIRAGDVLTVVLQESTQASKQSGTSIGKSSNLSAKAGRLLGHPLPIDTDAGLKRDFNGTGSSSQQNALRGSVSVIVQRVMPNGLLQVRGEKRLALNQGEEVVRLSGYVRVADIDPGNRVSSQQIANARIQYSGRGSLAEASQPGCLLRTCIIIENDRPASWLLSMAPIRSSLWPLSTAAILSPATCCCSLTRSIADFMVCAKPGPPGASACSATPGTMPARVPSMAWSIGLESSIFMGDSGDKGRGWGPRIVRAGRAAHGQSQTNVNEAMRCMRAAPRRVRRSSHLNGS